MPLTDATHKFIQEVKQQMEQNPIDLNNLNIEDYRHMCAGYQSFSAPLADGISIQTIKIPVTHDAEIEARIFDKDSQRKENKPCFIFIPGGGFIAYLDCHDSACSIMAAIADCRVIMIMPRLAPEFKAPIPLQDACEAIAYIFNHGRDQFNIDTNNIAIGGDSAGANLALGAALHFRDIKDNAMLPTPIKSLQLISGTYDLSMSLGNDFIEQEAEDLLPREMLEYMFSHYLEPNENPKDPAYSPYFANLQGLPPIDLLVAEYDGVRHQTEKLHEKLQASDATSSKHVLDGQTHSYLILRGEGAMNEGTDPAKVVATHLTDIFTSASNLG